MSDAFMKTGLPVPLSPYRLDGALSQTWFNNAWLLLASLKSYSLLANSTWRWLLWPVTGKQKELAQVDSSKIYFILSGERFPIDLIGSYNIDRAKSIIDKAPRTSVPTDVDVWQAFADQMEWQHLGAAREAAVDYSIPVIIATVDKAGERYMLIDGWHRVHKAKKEGRDVIQAFYLTEEETKEVFEISFGGLSTKP